MALTFEFSPSKESAKRAANEFTEIVCVADNDICKAWRMIFLGIHDVHITKYNDGEYRYICNDGTYCCTISDDSITITEGKYMGRKRKAEKMLKIFVQSAMRIWCLVNAGMID